MIPLSWREWAARISVQRIDELRRSHRVWKGRGEPHPLHKLSCEVLLVGFQLLLPVALVDHYSLANFLRVREKLVQPNHGHRKLMRTAESRCADPVTVSGFVNAFHQVAALLELN